VQYSAVECTRARVAVCNVVAEAPQLKPASHLRRAVRDVSFLQSDSSCQRYVSDLSNVIPRYLGSEQKGSVSLLKLTFSSRLASLLLKWKTAGLFSYLSAILIKAIGYVLNTQEFRNAICMRYGWKINVTLTHRACGETNSVDHSLVCKLGRYTSMRHNSVRDSKAHIMRKVCKKDQIEHALLQNTENMFEKS